MVVRGGYGLFYFGGQFDNINILQLNPPTAGQSDHKPIPTSIPLQPFKKPDSSRPLPGESLL